MAYTLRDSRPTDLKIINDWRIARGLDSIFELPKVGSVACFHEHPIAAGFIRRIEGNWGMFDSYVTDASQKPRVRHEALDCLTLELLAKAKVLGMTSIISFSTDTRTIERAQKHGFALYPSQVLFRSI